MKQSSSVTGPDRGILLCEAGFQSGAHEAAQLTNVQATSLAEMQSIAGPTIYSMRLLDLIDRITQCKDRYWNIPKELRIASGLRAEAGEHNYSGNRVIEMCSDLVSRAIGGRFPFVSESPGATTQFGVHQLFGSAKEVVQVVDAELTQLETKLDAHDPMAPICQIKRLFEPYGDAYLGPRICTQAQLAPFRILPPTLHNVSRVKLSLSVRGLDKDWRVF